MIDLFELFPPDRSVAWMDRGACVGVDPEYFYPKKADSPKVIERAKSFCDACPVQRECLEAALLHEAHASGPQHRHGIVGGMTPNERTKYVASLNEVAA